jgi:hypothetical protein
MEPIALPDSLKQQIASYESRLKRMETLLAIAGAAAGFLVMFVALMILDRFYESPKWLRASLLILGTVAAGSFAQRWSRDWLWKRRSANDLAILLGKHFRSLGDRIQGVLELSQTGELPPNISPALCRAAIAQVAQESTKFDFTQAVPVKPTRQWGWAAAVVVGLAAVPFFVVPKAASNAAQRFLAPLADIERYTFASLEALPKDLYVAHGEPFSLEIALAADSAWKPEEAKARISTQEPITVTLAEHRATLPLPPQTKDATLTLSVGDAQKEIALHPLHRPELKNLTARIQPPDYLQLPATTKVIQGGTAEFLLGSQVQLEGKIARPLASASMEGEAAPTTTKGDTFLTAAINIGDATTTQSLTWIDEHQLKPAQPYTLKVLPAKDAEPKIELKDMEPETAILTSELVKLNFAASDDFGLKETWIGWTVSSTGADRKVLTKGETPHETGAPTTNSISGTIDWSPMWHKIPEDTQVEIAAYTVDYFPERKPSASWKHTIWVLSPAKHAEKVRDRMDAVLKQLDDRIRDEERQLEENKAIAERKEQLNDEKTTEEIKRLEAGEKTNDEQLQKLTAEMENVMKDALRNKEIPEGTLSDWDKLTKKLQEEAQPSVAKATEKLAKASNAKAGPPKAGKPGKPSDSEPPPNPNLPSPDEPKREEELAQAQENQEKALDSMRDAAKKMNTVNENLYARNFYNRLRHSAQQEHTVSTDLKKLAKSTVGLRPSEIGETAKKDFQKSANNQDTTTTEVESLVNDMGTFIARLPNEKYGMVHKEMEEKKVVGALAELASFVRANLVMKSVGTARSWGEQLDAWAGMLQDECNCKGEGNAEMPPEMMELLIALVRAAQEQDGLREQTQALDARQWTTDTYGDDASKLGELQSKLAATMAELGEKTTIDEAKPLLAAVNSAMTDVALKLGAPQTDKNTVADQSIIIEMLVPPDKKGGKSSSSAMAKMQQAAQKMMAKGQKPGKGNNKADSGMAVANASGAALKDKANQRLVDKSSGAANASEWPAEFRDQLQSFFNNVDAPAEK